MAYSTIAKPSVGDPVSKTDFGDKAVDNLEYLHLLRDMSHWIPINGATPLVSGDKGYWRVPHKFAGGTLVGVAGGCTVASSSGAVVLTIRDFTAGVAMLSTNITLDQNETDTLTAATPAVIDAAHNTLIEGHKIEVSVVSAGTGATYVAAELTVRPA